MAIINSAAYLERAAIPAFVCSAAIFSLILFSQARALAQNTGPLPAATPSDQPSQAAAARSTAPVTGKPNLAGTWKLNAGQSDNPMQKMREAQQESGGGFGGPGGGRRGGFGGGGGGYGGGYGGRNGGGQQNGDDQQADGNRRRGGGAQAMAQLTIEQSPTSAKVSDSTGRVVALYLASPEQGSSQSPSGANEANTAPAQWQDNKLVTTVQMPNGGTTTRSYEIPSDNKQLIVTTKIENQRLKQPVTIRQVYDPVYANTGRN